MSAYYNEIDPYAAEWLRNLIKAGHIADGDVDERSIIDVRPIDLKGYTQCHFFAGIGVWSHALRAAGWGDSRPVWTGSCPCQPFSVAGAGAGTADERHLWPVWYELIRQCRPELVFGEQVEAAIRHGWLDLVQGDLEGIGYAVAAAGIPASSVGAPHIRHRVWFVGDSGSPRLQGGQQRGACDGERHRRDAHGPVTKSSGTPGGLADADGGKFNGVAVERGNVSHGAHTGRTQECSKFKSRCDNSRVVNTDSAGPQSGRVATATAGHGHSVDSADSALWPSPHHGFWDDADWIFCRDGKWRPIEPGTFPLAHGAPARVGRLRAYGNSIVPQVAQAFIEAYLETRP
jgi:DNA (cytosine-5)-methyltransferase 1